MMKTGKVITQLSDVLTVAKCSLLAELAFIGGRDVVQSAPNLSAVVTLKGGSLEALQVLSGNAILSFRSSQIRRLLPMLKGKAHKYGVTGFKGAKPL